MDTLVRVRLRLVREPPLYDDRAQAQTSSGGRGMQAARLAGGAPWTPLPPGRRWDACTRTDLEDVGCACSERSGKGGRLSASARVELCRRCCAMRAWWGCEQRARSGVLALALSFWHGSHFISCHAPPSAPVRGQRGRTKRAVRPYNAYKRSVASYLAALAPLALRGPPPPGRRTGTPALGSMRDATRAAWRCGPLHPHQERRRETQSPATARARPNPACRVARVTHAPRAAHTRTV